MLHALASCAPGCILNGAIRCQERRQSEKPSRTNVRANRRARRRASSCTKSWTKFVTESTGQDRRNKPLRSVSPKRAVLASIFLRQGKGRPRRTHAAAPNTHMKQAKADARRGAGRSCRGTVVPCDSGQLPQARHFSPPPKDRARNPAVSRIRGGFQL